MRRHFLRWTPGEIVSTVAHLLLLAFIVHLLLANYDAQTELRASLGRRLLRGLERQAEEMGYFLSERGRDLLHLAESREVQLYFENLAMGMSREYGLAASLTQAKDAFQRLVAERTANDTPIFEWIVLIDHQGVPLVSDTAGVLLGSAIDWRLFAQKPKGIFWDPAYDPDKVFFTVPVLFKNVYAGQLVASLGTEVIFSRLASRGGTDPQQMEALFHDGRLVHPRTGDSAVAGLLGKNATLAESSSEFRNGRIVCHVTVPGTAFRFASSITTARLFGSASPARQLMGIGAVGAAALFLILGIMRHRERRRMTEALVKSEERLSHTLNATNDAIWDWDLVGGSRYFSSRWFEMLGMTEKDCLTRFPDWSDLLHPDDRQNAEASLHQHLVGETELFDAECRCLKGGGEWLWIKARGKVVARDADGKPLRIVGTYADITPAKEAEQALEETNRSLEERVRERTSLLLQAEKMASVGQLATGIAHEINNPAGFVTGNLNTLREYVRDLMQLIQLYGTILNTRTLDIPDRIREKLDDHMRQIGFDFIKGDINSLLTESIDGMARISRIVGDLKDFSHIDREDSYADTDLNLLIDKAINVAWNELKYKCEIHKEYGSLPPVPCNGGKISQVMLNLLVNAAQAMEGHGEVIITTSAWGNVATIVISDTGPGIPESILGKIFDPFFTTKPVGKGTGLGLHICQKIIALHGGSITATNSAQGGAVFTITLPLMRLENLRETHESAPADPPDTGAQPETGQTTAPSAL